MTVFDFADTMRPCAQRDVTTVALQALALLNNAFVYEQSGRLADRIACESLEDDLARIDCAWRLALGRPPSSTEMSEALEHMEEQRRLMRQLDHSDAEVCGLSCSSLCHVLFNLNEFN